MASVGLKLIPNQRMLAILDEYYRLVPEDQAHLYQEIADQAILLGFKPKKEKTKHFCVSFSSNKYRATIMKFVYDKHGPELRLKFFASKNYSSVFDLSLKKAIEDHDLQYTGCYECGKCVGELEGYTVVFADGREYFRCGFELIELIDLNEAIKDEVITLLKAQTEYYQNKLAAYGE